MRASHHILAPEAMADILIDLGHRDATNLTPDPVLPIIALVNMARSCIWHGLIHGDCVNRISQLLLLLALCTLWLGSRINIVIYNIFVRIIFTVFGSPLVSRLVAILRLVKV